MGVDEGAVHRASLPGVAALLKRVRGRAGGWAGSAGETPRDAGRGGADLIEGPHDDLPHHHPLHYPLTKVARAGRLFLKSKIATRAGTFP